MSYKFTIFYRTCIKICANEQILLKIKIYLPTPTVFFGSLYSVVLYTPLESLKMALRALLKDSSFQIPSDSAKEAHLAASEMLEWLTTPDNAALATPISQRIMAALSKCITENQSNFSKPVTKH